MSVNLAGVEFWVRHHLKQPSLQFLEEKRSARVHVPDTTKTRPKSAGSKASVIVTD